MLPADLMGGAGGFPARGRKRLPADLAALVAAAERLSPQDRASLLAFAEFLGQPGRSGDAAALRAVDPPLPEPAPRPEKESVIKAMRRLSASYSMLERGKLLNETSTLMAQHVMQGRDAVAVIDDLERLFAERYEAFCRDWRAQRQPGDG